MLLPLGILASSGGAALADYELISTTILGSAAASVTFSGLGTSAAAYKHLQIRVVARHDVANQYDSGYIQFNGDTAGNYSFHELTGSGSSVASGGGSSSTRLWSTRLTGSSATANSFAGNIVDILDFASTSKNKTVRGFGGLTSSSNLVQLVSGAWLSTSAVTSILLAPNSGNFVTGSRFSLYGLRA